MIRRVDVSKNAHEPVVTQPGVRRGANRGIGAATPILRNREQIVDVHASWTRHQIAVDFRDVAALGHPAVGRERAGGAVHAEKPSFAAREPLVGLFRPADGVRHTLEESQVPDASFAKIEGAAGRRFWKRISQVAFEEHQHAEIHNRLPTSALLRSRSKRVLPRYLKTLSARHKWILIACLAASGAWSRRRFAGGRIDHAGGSSHSRLNTRQSVEYFERVVLEYVRYGNLRPRDIEGCRFLELGVGDNLGVALRFLAAGAREYVCLDQFHSPRDASAERQIYIALRERIPRDQRPDFDDAVSLAEGIALNPARIRTIYGRGAQEADRVFSGEKFDLILSRAVLHEVSDIDGAFVAMDAMLGPGGRMLHKIDLRDYGMFSARGFHPREYLTIPEWIYERMTRDCGRPNRRLIDYYRRKMQELDYEAGLYPTCVLDVRGYRGVQEEFEPPKSRIDFGVDYWEAHRALIAGIRPRLLPKFRDLSEEDLLTASVFLAARKPGYD